MSTIATILAVLASVAMLVFVVVFVIKSPIGWRRSAAFGASGWTVVLLIVIWALFWPAWQ